MSEALSLAAGISFRRSSSMNLLVLTISSGLILTLAYFTYGRWISRKLELRDDVPTPACQFNDGLDFVPTPAPYLFSQHFSAIAAAGPIVGPIAAGLLFGWVPALVWILVGCIFIGAVHDITSLVASVRHKARSIAEVVREHMSRRAYLLFLAFVWISLVYIIVAFTDLTASTFAPAPPPADATAEVIAAAQRNIETGKAVASSSMMYLGLAMVMGLVLRFTKLPLAGATAIFLPLVLVTIWAGPLLPLALPGWIAGNPAKTWDVLLLVYCFVASIVPVWFLLQPRGYLGGYFLTITVAAAFLGILAASFTGQLMPIQYPAFTSFEPSPGVFLFPILFVTIACGACSGFHSIISSGTSSKQLRKETDARPIGFGCMLLEGFVAVISLATVMILAPGSKGQPDQIFSEGISRMIATLASAFGMDYETARGYLLNFALLAFATFIYDTLDVCTRLGRYVLQEFSGWHTKTGRYVCTLLTLAPPMYLLLMTDGTVPAWRVFWTLFGTANQMLAALTLVGVTVWLIRTGKSWWFTAAPAVFMLLVTLASLGMFLVKWARQLASRTEVDPNGPLSSVLFVLALLLVVEAGSVVLRSLRVARLETGTTGGI
jgi:carbon starvation protein